MLNQLLPELQVPAVAIHGICEDSRMVRDGDLFCAVVGEKVDGRRYISAAIKNGAAAVLSEPPLADSGEQSVPVVAVDDLHNRLGEIAGRFYGHPDKALQIFAVTGTNGKTSFTQLLAQALSAAKMPCGMIGTMGHGIPGALKDPGLTTPSAIDIQRRLRDLVDTGCAAAVLEASSHGIKQGRLAGVSIGTAILTNITHDHLDYHETFEAYRKAKEQLFHMGTVRNAVINMDDEFSKELVERLDSDVRVIGYSLGQGTDVSLEKSMATPDGVDISVLVSGEIIKAHLPLFGTFNVQNVLAVIATLYSMDCDTSLIESMLGELSTVPGRMDVMRRAGRPTIIVDYAHTPDALEKALIAVREHFGDQHVTCVFGCGGDRDQSKRPLMGEVASRFSDRIVITSDNPRTESPDAIIREIQSGVNAKDVLVSVDRTEAIRQAIGMATKDSIVMIAGKGHEAYQELASGRVPYSDYAVIDEVMRFNVIVGLGETGLSYARFLAARGEDFVVVDDNPDQANIAALEKIKPGAVVERINAERLTQADKVFVSPGVPLSNASLVQARAAGVSLLGDVQLFGQLADAPLIGITGSNGKSTVSRLVFEMIRDQDRKVTLAGNIGTPCLDMLSETADYHVLEVSSYQLELATELTTAVAVVLNLVPDHLDRYKSEADYYQTKLALYSHTKKAVANRAMLNQLDGLEAAATFGTDVLPGDNHFGVSGQGKSTCLMQGNNILMPVDELGITGSHNVQNVLASLAVGWLVGLDMNGMLDTARRFQGLPHRSEIAGEVRGVLYINDSKATNPGAMVAAVKGQANGRNIHLIAGGLSKGLGLEGLAEELGPCLKGVYLIGADYSDWSKEFRDLAPNACDVLENAVLAAAGKAEPGDIVLLSPGCASQDQFRNYIERGNKFKDLVRGLEP